MVMMMIWGRSQNMWTVLGVVSMWVRLILLAVLGSLVITKE